MVKFVYFDVGGVVVLDFSKTNKYHDFSKEIGIPEDKEKEFLNYWDYKEPNINTGFDADLLIPEIEEKFQIKIPKNYSLLYDGFISRFEINKSILPVIHKLKKLYKIGLLTNQYPRMFKILKRIKLLPKISWDVIIDSSIEKIKKPNPKIYGLAEELSKVKGEEIFFIDNKDENLKTAKKFKWLTFLYDSAHPKKSSKELIQYFQKNI